MAVLPEERAPEGLSVVIPVLNERDNLEALHDGLVTVLDSLERPSEVIYVDDGSNDGSSEWLVALAERDSRARVVRLARSFGQTAALSAGIDHARHDVVVTMDADLQNDPKDIPRLLEELADGADVVSGWRRERHDAFWSRRFPSWLANALAARLTGLGLHDFGCSLKAYRRHLFDSFRLYGEMHRFVPAYCAWAGGRVVEVEVAHHPRRAGRSKYGIGRTGKVLLDLLTLKLLLDFGSRPIHLFGAVGVGSCIMGCIAGAVTLIQRWHDPTAFVHRNPLILLAVFLFLLGVQVVMLGLLAEIGIRTYHEARGAPPYVVARVHGTTPGPQEVETTSSARVADGGAA
ncbi:MAG: glycosyltransferase family 2 protein [Acidobacteriota bacterium]